MQERDLLVFLPGDHEEGVEKLHVFVIIMDPDEERNGVGGVVQSVAPDGKVIGDEAANEGVDGGHIYEDLIQVVSEHGIFEGNRRSGLHQTTTHKDCYEIDD